MLTLDVGLVAVSRGGDAVDVRGSAVSGRGTAILRRGLAVNGCGATIPVVVMEDFDESLHGSEVESREPTFFGSVSVESGGCAWGLVAGGEAGYSLLRPSEAFGDLLTKVPQPAGQLPAPGGRGRIAVARPSVAGLPDPVTVGRA